MLPHRAGSKRMVRGGVRSRPDAWQHPRGHRRKCAGGSHRIAKMQREGLGTNDDSELYFETQHNCTGKRTLGSLARAVSEARAGASDGGRSAAVNGQNTVLPSHSGLTEGRVRSVRS